LSGIYTSKLHLHFTCYCVISRSFFPNIWEDIYQLKNMSTFGRSIELIQQPSISFAWRKCRISFSDKRIKEYLFNSRFCWGDCPALIFFSLHYYFTEREESFQIRLEWCIEEFTQTHTNGYMNYYYPQSKANLLKIRFLNK